VVKFTTDCNRVGYTTAMFVVINKAKWDSLDPAIQKVMEATSRKWIDVHGNGWDRVDAEGREFAVGLGNEMIALDDAQAEQWKAKVRPIIDEYITGATAAKLDGQAYVDMLTVAISGQN
jgi:TRAP-type C4-dicarboxylate transport system substrate-binding protein